MSRREAFSVFISSFPFFNENSALLEKGFPLSCFSSVISIRALFIKESLPGFLLLLIYDRISASCIEGAVIHRVQKKRRATGSDFLENN